MEIYNKKIYNSVNFLISYFTFTERLILTKNGSLPLKNELFKVTLRTLWTIFIFVTHL